jgi:starvation-inducible DNA-binding protein
LACLCSSASHLAKLRDIAGALNLLLADIFALYLKTKNFHWHMSGPHFRDYHLLLDEQAGQIFAMTDAVAERVRKIGARPFARSVISGVFSAFSTMTRRSSRRRTCFPNCATTTSNWWQACAKCMTFATNVIDETERRTWFLFEATRAGAAT